MSNERESPCPSCHKDPLLHTWASGCNVQRGAGNEPLSHVFQSELPMPD